MSHQTTSAPMQAMPLSRRFATFLHAVSFVLGFSLIFVVLFGGAFAVLKEFLVRNKVEISQIAGAIIILFGLATMRVIKIPFLYYDTRRQFAGRPELGFASSFAMGMFFAAGWTPCIGTVLGAILNLPAQGSPATTTLLLAIGYSIGLGVPFLIMGLLIDRMGRFVRKLTRYLRAIEIFTGLFLIALGVLLVSGEFTATLARLGASFTVSDSALPGADDPTFLIAILGGLLSFLSPCVLPLVPAYIGYLSSHVVGQTAANSKST
ncbi:MAG TPA: cytochrome c biogenesis protein CcdA [Anaerolineae bacterium]